MKLSAANTIAPYLANNNNDPVLAFNAMSNAPADKNKMNAVALAGYTPDVIEKMGGEFTFQKVGPFSLLDGADVVGVELYLVGCLAF
ncbi:MAG: hypothetical protein WB795_12535 [Candidatus Acidiferrales bacterium]